MNLFSTVLRRKRGVILFVAAFMLPLFFVVVVSIDTFSKRQKTTRNLLESNLWFSGRSALDQLETKLIELETAALNDTCFNSLLKDKSLKQNRQVHDIFIIDKNFRVLYPEVAEEKNDYFLFRKKNWNPDYKNFMGKAETAEFSNQNYDNAIKNYQISRGLAKTTQQEALAIEGMARAHLANKNYKQAIRYYQLLKNQYNLTKNPGGHPYGISSALQLNAIGSLNGSEVFNQDSLLLTYKKIKDGDWLISASSYFFFKAEFESILKIDYSSTGSKFERRLNFNQFINNYIIPAIQERSEFSEFNNSEATKRTYIENENNQYLVSFKEIHSTDNNFHFEGIRWNLDTVISQIIPPILDELSTETGLEFRLLNDDNLNMVTGLTTQVPEESLTLSFRDIPFPWSLVAIQPGYKKLQSDAKAQMIIYGLLFIFIIVLMLFGVFVLLRDISRETHSTQLQTEFVHNVSHELKTPLSLIRLYGETLLIKEHLPEEDRKEGLQIITKESERLSYMINNILDFSKIEMGRKEFDFKTGNLAKIVMNTLDSYRYHFVKKGFTMNRRNRSEYSISFT